MEDNFVFAKNDIVINSITIKQYEIGYVKVVILVSVDLKMILVY